MEINAQQLCDTVVEHYYKILDSKPQEVHQFYKDCSTLSRPDASGVLGTVTTTHGINEKIMSLNENDRKVDVKSADAVDSHDGGVIIFVTGSVSGLNFAQTFFLARQEKGHFILTDIFRYIETCEASETISDEEELIGNQLEEDDRPPANSAAQALKIQSNPKPVEMKTAAPSSMSDSTSAHAAASQVEPKLAEMSYKSKLMQDVAKVAFTEANKQPTATAAPSVVKNTAGKTTTATAASSHVVKNTAGKTTAATAASSVVKNTAGKTTAATLQSERGESYSIYLSGLPPNLTPAELEEECKKFGAISSDGVQVRTKLDGFSFGFVAFVHKSSVQKALKASPLIINGKRTYVQVKTGGPYGGGGAGAEYANGGGRSDRDGYYRNESHRGRRNDGNRGGHSGGDYHRPGSKSNAGGSSVRQEDRRTRQGG